MASKSYEQVVQNRQSPQNESPKGIEAGPAHKEPKSSVRQSEFPVSRHGMNQESEHNKHNRQPAGARKS